MSFLNRAEWVISFLLLIYILLEIYREIVKKKFNDYQQEEESRKQSIIIAQRAPTEKDKGFQIGTLWISNSHTIDRFEVIPAKNTYCGDYIPYLLCGTYEKYGQRVACWKPISLEAVVLHKINSIEEIDE